MTEAVMIFAAGFGTRMGDLTKDTPKPMLHVAGRPLIDHALGYVAEAGVDRIVVNTHYKAEKLHDHLRSRTLQISHEKQQILDTGGGLRAALPLLNKNPVFTLNPDVFWIGPNPLNYLRQLWNPDKMDALLLCTPLERTYNRTGGGDFDLDADGNITRSGNLVYGGAQIIKTETFRQVDETVFSMNLIWNQMNETGRLHLAEYPGEWCDIGSPEGIPVAERLLERQRV